VTLRVGSAEQRLRAANDLNREDKCA
jgi:hypothetical protein